MNLSLDPAETAAWVQAAAVVLAVVVAVWQILEVRRTRRHEARAYVVVMFEFHADRMALPDLTVTNLGATAATDVKVSYSPELRSQVWANPKPDAFMRGGIETLVPGQRLSTIFDSMVDRPREWEDRYVATVAFRDAFGKPHRDSFVLDLAPFRSLTYVDRKGVHHVHEELKKLVREVKRIREGGPGGPLPVQVQTTRAHRRNRLVRSRPEWRGGAVPDTVIRFTLLREWIASEWRALRAWFA